MLKLLVIFDCSLGKEPLGVADENSFWLLFFLIGVAPAEVLGRLSNPSRLSSGPRAQHPGSLPAPGRVSSHRRALKKGSRYKTLSLFADTAQTAIHSSQIYFLLLLYLPFKASFIIHFNFWRHLI